ncbi:MAG: hypothetical protein HY928_14335, partial [Elusimicrobia bacterium]|nr:hypothetical protein [Elusimicrobiota bacterium]
TDGSHQQPSRRPEGGRRRIRTGRSSDTGPPRGLPRDLRQDGRGRAVTLFVEPPRIDSGLPEPRRWLDHAEYLLPSKEEREHVLDVLAFNVQHLDGKVNHAVVLYGMLGSGKDLFFQPIRNWLKDCGGWNDVKVEDMVGSAFNQYLFRAKFLVVQESREMAFDAGFGLYNSLKTVIAAPPPTLEVNLKHMRPFSTPNLVQVFFFTNYQNGVYFEDEKDRRYFVTETAPPKKTPAGDVDSAYYSGLAAWIEDQWPSVIAWLQQRDISAFKPGAPPPDTAARRAMYEETRPSAYGEIGAGLALVEQPFTADELRRTLEFAGALTKNVERALEKGSRALSNLLRPLGFTRVTHRPYRNELDSEGKPTGVRRRVEVGLWFHPDRMDAEGAKEGYDARHGASREGK